MISNEKIIDCLSEGVYACDRQRRIVYWNKSAERITGWRAEEVVGRACLEDILNHVDKDGHRLCGREHCPLHRAMVTGKSTAMPMIVYALHKNGRRQWLGVQGLLKIVQSLGYPQAPLDTDALAAGLLKHSNAIRLQDDVTVIAVRIADVRNATAKSA